AGRERVGAGGVPDVDLRARRVVRVLESEQRPTRTILARNGEPGRAGHAVSGCVQDEIACTRTNGNAASVSAIVRAGAVVRHTVVARLVLLQHPIAARSRDGGAV